MTPALATLLIGQVAALSAPPPPESSGDYAVSRGGLVCMVLILAAQEAERGPAARAWENAALRSLLEDVAGDYAEAVGGALPAAPPAPTWSALDAHNADLRRRLIAVHETADARGDRALQRRILALYVDMAQAHRLDLPGAAG